VKSLIQQVECDGEEGRIFKILKEVLKQVFKEVFKN